MISSQLLERIRALCRLSKDPANEHEAALAADRVRTLLEKHNLSLRDVVEQRVEGAEAVAGRWSRLPRYVVVLANACKLMFDVAWFHSRRGIVFCGLEANIAAAVETLDYFDTAILSLLLLRTSIRARRRRNSYRLGAATRVAYEVKRLKDEAVATSADSTALVHIGTAVAKRVMDRHALTTCTRRAKPPRPNKAFIAGWIDGEKINARGAPEMLPS